MPPTSSRRTAPLPKGWEKTRRRVARRDQHTCQLALNDRCQPHCPPGLGGECDHIGDPADHSLGNLRWVCANCHATRTAQQANAARPRRRRPQEPHPGAP